MITFFCYLWQAVSTLSVLFTFAYILAHFRQKMEAKYNKSLTKFSHLNIEETPFKQMVKEEFKQQLIIFVIIVTIITLFRFFL